MLVTSHVSSLEPGCADWPRLHPAAVGPGVYEQTGLNKRENRNVGRWRAIFMCKFIISFVVVLFGPTLGSDALFVDSALSPFHAVEERLCQRLSEDSQFSWIPGRMSWYGCAGHDPDSQGESAVTSGYLPHYEVFMQKVLVKHWKLHVLISGNVSDLLIHSYKSFLPKEMRAQIQDCNFLTRKRIRFRFKRFIQQFSQCRTTVRDLKLKYLISMESLEKAFYTETFQVREQSKGQLIVLVAADSGIRWCQEKLKDSDEVGNVFEGVLPFFGPFWETSLWMMGVLLSPACSGAAELLWFPWCHWHQHQTGQQRGSYREPSGHHQQTRRQERGNWRTILVTTAAV